jgi:putative DNA primase/helicase
MEREGHPPQEITFPEPLPVHFESLPEQLRGYDQWVNWKYAMVEGEVKKPPFSPCTRKLASVRDGSTWGSFHEARRAYETGQFAGVGIVLTSDMGIVGIDIDHCVRDGQLTPETQRIITALNSYTERSPSGTGIRIMLEGKLLGTMRRRGNLEMYEDLRYVTLTGHHLAHTPQEVQPRHRELSSEYQRLFGLVSYAKLKENTGEGEHRLISPVARSDQQVLHKALQAKNGENFRRYYSGDASLWEGKGARHASQSEADFTLVLMLLYWTNDDITQVDRLFRQSGLMREKWTRPIKGHETYGERLMHDAMRKSRY